MLDVSGVTEVGTVAGTRVDIGRDGDVYASMVSGVPGEGPDWGNTVDTGRDGRDPAMDGRLFVAEIGFEASNTGRSSRGLLVGVSKPLVLDVVRRSLPKKPVLLRDNGFLPFEGSGEPFCRRWLGGVGGLHTSVAALVIPCPGTSPYACVDVLVRLSCRLRSGERLRKPSGMSNIERCSFLEPASPFASEDVVGLVLLS